MLLESYSFQALNQRLWCTARSASCPIEEAKPGVSRIYERASLVIEFIAHLQAHHRHLLDNNSYGQHLVEICGLNIL